MIHYQFFHGLGKAKSFIAVDPKRVKELSEEVRQQPVTDEQTNKELAAALLGKRYVGTTYGNGANYEFDRWNIQENDPQKLVAAYILNEKYPTILH